MDRREFLKLTALGAAGVLTGGRPGAALAGAQPQPVVGIASHMLRPQDIAQMRDLGLRHVRTTIYWPLWQRNEQSYRAAMRENLERTVDAGIRPLVVLHNAWGGVFRSPVDPAMWDRFADWSADLAHRFRAVEGWQLWNEQDMWVQAPFGAGARPRLSARATGENYARQLLLAYPRIRQANPDALIVTGGTADHAQERWRGFLAGMMAAEPPCDAVAVHAYGPWERVAPVLREARDIVGGRAPVWLTECGNDRPDRFDAGYQAACWRSVLEGNARERLTPRVYPYCLQTDPNDSGHGLFQLDGSRRPVYAVLRRHVRR